MARWNPKNELVNLRDRVGRMVEQGLASINGSPTIALDMFETEEAIVVRSSPVLGLKAEELDVSITGDTLTIRGEIKADEAISPDEVNFLRRERRFGKFQRSVTIPRPIKAEATTAAYEDGILTITIPKAEEARPRVIEVQSSDD